MKSSSKLKNIGITLGDPSGIGPEVTAKALLKYSIRSLANFILIGNPSLFKKYAPQGLSYFTFIDPQSAPPKMKSGISNRLSAKAALSYLNEAVRLLKVKKIDALVTAPVCKETINDIDPAFTGHTEFLQKAFSVKRVEMLFVYGKFRTVVLTRHIPLSKVPSMIKADLVYKTIKLTNESLKSQFAIKHPVIAISGVNPHAGENGKLGKEEIREIIPAIQKAKKKGISVDGPFPGDTLFIPENRLKYDCFITMHHDQGLAPIKALYFRHLVNVTIGLPFIRTSPAHGTAFDIAGRGKADPSSMIEAIKLAVQLRPR